MQDSMTDSSTLAEQETKQGRTFAVATLGCKVNQADSEAISEQMCAAGFAQRDFGEQADVYIVNTCTVTHLGDRSSRQMISQARRRHPGALMVVTGCYAELNPDGVAALPGVDLVVGNRGKDTLVEAIEGQWPSWSASSNEQTRLTPDEQHRQRTTQAGVSSRLLPVLPLNNLDSQHIGSDIALIGADAEPRPDNPSTTFDTPIVSAVSATPANTPLYSRTRVQMKVQDG